MATRILFTGFGRFPGAAHNPSGQLAQRLAQRRRPAFAGTERAAHIFRTSYTDVDRQLPGLIEQMRPHAILMFGVALRTSRLRIETLARNRMSLIFPDVDGVVPRSAKIAMGAPARTPGHAPFRRLLAAARGAGVKATLSRDAGSYLCNYGYWRAIEAAAQAAGPRLVIFVHIPRIRSRSRKHGKRRAATMSKLVRAGEAIAVAAISALRAGPEALWREKSRQR